MIHIISYYSKLSRSAAVKTCLATLIITNLAGCGMTDNMTIKHKYPVKHGNKYYSDEKDIPVKGKLFGDLRFRNGKFVSDKQQGNDGSGIGVNAYLWRATIDTLSFMQIDKADPFSGIVTTKWYYPKIASNERVKVNAIILDKKLHANALRVSIIKEKKIGTQWKNIEASEEAQQQLELNILNKARKLKSNKAYDNT